VRPPRAAGVGVVDPRRAGPHGRRQDPAHRLRPEGREARKRARPRRRLLRLRAPPPLAPPPPPPPPPPPRPPRRPRSGERFVATLVGPRLDLVFGSGADRTTWTRLSAPGRAPGPSEIPGRYADSSHPGCERVVSAAPPAAPAGAEGALRGADPAPAGGGLRPGSACPAGATEANGGLAPWGPLPAALRGPRQVVFDFDAVDAPGSRAGPILGILGDDGVLRTANGAWTRLGD